MGYRSDVAYIVCFKDEEVDVVSEVDGVKKIDKVNRGKDMFYIFLAEAKTKAETAMCFLGESGESEFGFLVDEINLHISVQAESVKWYEGYPDVDCHDALINMADEYCDSDNEWVEKVEKVEKVVGFSFVRIGEEDDDIKCRWGGWKEAINRCQLTRGIHFDDGR